MNFRLVGWRTFERCATLNYCANIRYFADLFTLKKQNY